MSSRNRSPKGPFTLVYFERWADPVAEEILRAEPHVHLVRLARTDSPDTVWRALESAHGFQITSARSDIIYTADGSLVARCPQLIAISTSGAGFDTVDVQACTDAGVLAVNQTGANKQAVAEHVLGMMLGLSRKMIQSDRAMRRDRNWTRLLYKGDDIHGKTVGIVGLGNIGSLVAKICGGTFDMEVLAYDPYLSAEEITRRGARKVTLDELFGRADFVSINCPLTAETRGMIGAAQYRLMKPDAYFITTARGGIHDEAALADALREGRIAGAGLDVWVDEPPPLDHPLLAFDNVYVTPHNAGVTNQAYRSMAEGAARQWLAIFEGARPPRMLNPEVWPSYRARFERIIGLAPVE